MSMDPAQPKATTPEVTPPNGESVPPKKKSLWVFILVIFILLILAVGASYALFFSSDDEGMPEPTVVPTVETSVVTTPGPTIVTRDLYSIIDCQAFQATSTGELELLATGDSQLCNRNGLIAYSNSMPVYNSDPETDEQYRLPLVNVKTGDVYDALAIDGEAYFDETENILFYELYDDGIYKGTLTDAGSKIYDMAGKGIGRGIGPSDDFGLRLNNEGTRLIFQETADSLFEVEDDADEYLKTGAIILSPTGSTLLEIPGGSQTKWVDNDTLLSVVQTSSDGNRVLRRYVFDDARFSYVDLAVLPASFGTIYQLDALGDSVVLGVQREDTSFTNYRGDISGDSTTLSDLGLATVDNYFVDSATLLGFVTTECSGDFEADDTELPCPIEAPFNVYKTSIARYNLETGELDVVMEMDDPALL